MVEKFNKLIAPKGFNWTLLDILPEVLNAGENAGFLTAEGAKKLDISGHSDIITTLGADSLEICDAVRYSEISSLCHDPNYSTTSPHRKNRPGGIVMFHRIMSMQPVE